MVEPRVIDLYIDMVRIEFMVIYFSIVRVRV